MSLLTESGSFYFWWRLLWIIGRGNGMNLLLVLWFDLVKMAHFTTTAMLHLSWKIYTPMPVSENEKYENEIALSDIPAFYMRTTQCMVMTDVFASACFWKWKLWKHNCLYSPACFLTGTKNCSSSDPMLGFDRILCQCQIWEMTSVKMKLLVLTSLLLYWNDNSRFTE